MSSLPSERLVEVIRFQTEIVRTGMDLGQVMSRTAELSQRLLQADGAVVELAEGDEMVYRAVAGIASSLLGLRLPAADSLSGLCVAEGRALRCDDPAADPRVNLAACRRVGLQSMIVVPLLFREQTVGVLKVLSRRPSAFTDQDAEALTLLSDIVAAAMAHAVDYGHRQLEMQDLYRLATRDGLTGLANRAAFMDRLRQALAAAQRAQGTFGVVMLDMDGLKGLNDVHGHAAGDEGLREFGRRLQRATRDTDLAARLGGDEFAVLLADAADETAVRAVRRISESVEGSFAFEDATHPLRASLGLAVFPEDGAEVESLLERADQRMYAVKRARKGG